MTRPKKPEDKKNRIARKDRVWALLPNYAPTMANLLNLQLAHVNQALRELEAEDRAHVKVPRVLGRHEPALWAKGPYPSEAQRLAARPKPKTYTLNPGPTTAREDELIEKARQAPANWFSTLGRIE